MPKGGHRTNAGRKPKALTEKLLDGNPGRRDIKVNKFKPYCFEANNAKNHINLPEYIDMVSKEGGDTLPKAGEIYCFIAEFLKSSGCEHLIADFLLEDFAFLRRAYLECEYMNKKMGRIASQKRSPYVVMAIDYHKEMMSVYSQIWNVISKNSEANYESKNNFFEMLTNRGF